MCIRYDMRARDGAGLGNGLDSFSSADWMRKNGRIIGWYT